MTALAIARPGRATLICPLSDLVPGCGIAARCADGQVAIFYLPDELQRVYAIGNLDPMSGAAVLARGIVGDKAGELVVASPIYKHHYSLFTGRCLEEEAVSVPVYRALISDSHLYLVR
ncbi:MAG: nitrite reductase small subunit NirD [Pseudomonadales bacterium]|nr:nitrite reductase small subunit NirD [Pseudomonadales bacterium]